jgi:hypothetical protein
MILSNTIKTPQNLTLWDFGASKSHQKAIKTGYQEPEERLLLAAAARFNCAKFARVDALAREICPRVGEPLARPRTNRVAIIFTSFPGPNALGLNGLRKPIHHELHDHFRSHSRSRAIGVNQAQLTQSAYLKSGSVLCLMARSA